MVTTPLAHALFGESAYEDDVNFLVPEIKCFVDALIVQTWNRYRKAISADAKVLEKEQGILEANWKGEPCVASKVSETKLIVHLFIYT